MANGALDSRLQRLRRRLRQVLLVYGLSWVALSVVLSLLAIGLLDWALHLDDPGVRLLLALSASGICLWTAWRALVRPLLVPFRDIDLALWIERRFPFFRDRLASAVDFLHRERADTVGSAALQRRVIEETEHELTWVDVADVIETRPARRVAMLAAGVCLGAAALAVFHYHEAAIALARMVFPFSGPAWPSRHELVLLDAEFRPLPVGRDPALRVPRGEPLELYVEDQRGRLPESVVAEYRSEEQPHGTIETLRRIRREDPQGRRRELFSLPVPTESDIAIRVRGGDDQTDWYRLQVVPAPAVASIEATVTPPAYTGQSVKRLPGGIGDVEGVLGSRVDIRMQPTKPLAVARLRRDDRSQPLDYDESSQSYTTSFVIDRPGVSSYWFELRDTDGFENTHPQRYEIRGIEDRLPEVRFERPETDRQVTATAELDIRVYASDDLGLSNVRLRATSTGKEEAERTVPLLSEDPLSRPAPLLETVLEHRLQLAEFGLEPGHRLELRAEALDAFDLASPHIGRSAVRTLYIVSPEEKIAELAGRQAALLEQIEQLLEWQRAGRDRVAQLAIQLETAGRFSSEDFDLLHRTHLDQRRIAAGLVDPAEGVRRRLEDIYDELNANGLEQPQLRSRLEETMAALGVLAADQLPRIERDLTLLEKSLEADARFQPHGDAQDGADDAGTDGSDDSAKQTPPAPEPKPGDAPAGNVRLEPLREARRLRGIERAQSEVIASLEAVVGGLRRWRQRHELGRELAKVIDEQATLGDETAELAPQTINRPLGTLDPQKRADLRRLADRQRRLADQLDQLRKTTAELAREETQTDPATAELADRLERQLAREAVSGRMRDVSSLLERNSIGMATTEQRRILETLRALGENLHEEFPSDAESLLNRLKEAEQELETLRKKQQELRDAFDRLSQDANAADREPQLESLRKRQRRLREEAERLGARIERLRSSGAERSLRQATGHMQDAEEALKKTDQRRAGEATENALEELDRARRELAEDRQRAEEQLARELVEGVADELNGLLVRQQSAIEETLRLDEERIRKGRWSRAQLKTLLNLADSQRGLAEETEALAERLEPAAVISLALRGAGRSMLAASLRLKERQTDDQTRRRQHEAIERIQMILAAIGPEDQPPADRTPDKTEPMPPDQGGDDATALPDIAQLRLLKALQEDLRARTEALGRLRNEDGTWPPEKLPEVEALAEEQGELADLLEELMHAQRSAHPAGVE